MYTAWEGEGDREGMGRRGVEEEEEGDDRQGASVAYKLQSLCGTSTLPSSHLMTLFVAAKNQR